VFNQRRRMVESDRKTLKERKPGQMQDGRFATERKPVEHYVRHEWAFTEHKKSGWETVEPGTCHGLFKSVPVWSALHRTGTITVYFVCVNVIGCLLQQ